MNIAELNRVNRYNSVTPGYTLQPMHRQIEFYLTIEGKVIIIGAADSNYIYWLSVSSVKERETNAAIFDYISQCDYRILSQEYIVLPQVNMTYEALGDMYYGCLFRTGENGEEWKTPFGHYYGTDQKENNGLFFADDLAALPGSLAQQCKAREAEGLYIHVMQKYLDIIKERTGDDVADYYAAKPIIDIIEKEKYLCFSSNEEVRKLYTALCHAGNRLYNAYMTQVR